MLDIDDKQFEQLIADAMDDLAHKVAENMNNVAIVWSDEPTEQQRTKMRLRPNQTLFGLYEGIPLPMRGAGYNLVLPDKITLFKQPMLMASRDIGQLKMQIHNTLWHEIAHHFGLNHDQIHGLEGKA
ncbi:MAG: metallopeptidase family protein [Microcoleus sp.]